jgi:hypothetical protein
MKKLTRKLACIVLTSLCLNSFAQSPVAITFDEPTFTLTPNSYYKNTSVNDWGLGVTKFRYKWDTAFGGYWKSGTAYTNIKDTTNGTYTNLYGCAAFSAYNGTRYATVQDDAIITFSNTTTQVSGFFITNTTYAYKTMKFGNTFSRKFGDTTGTNSGGIYAQGAYPDFFKLVVFGYKDGIKKTDSVQFYLADYRFMTSSSDYIIKNWQYVNCTTIGVVDSLVFKLRSSDNGSFGMNTPGFFSIDNITTINTVGVNELENISNTSLYPNPTANTLNIQFESKKETNLLIRVVDVTGKNIETLTNYSQTGANQIELNMEKFESGIYMIELIDGISTTRMKVIKL